MALIASHEHAADRLPEPHILDVRALNVRYKTRRGVAQAVRDLSFQIAPGEAYGLVGESGCGKSTAALSIMRYLPRNAETAGAIVFNGINLLNASPNQLTTLRGDRIAMVYQDPQSSLNPVLTIGRQLTEVIQAHRQVTPTDAAAQALDMLHRVRMPDPNFILSRYPYQLSGGMQQRVVIAMALMLRPDLVIMDEPTTGLDVTIEAGVIDLINDLRHDFGMAVLFISHNLGIVSRLCGRVGVMYGGELVEEAAVSELFSHPRHPYTVGLLRCVPDPSLRHQGGGLYSIPGRVPSLTSLPPGCTFAARCAIATAACRAHAPSLEVIDIAHDVRCFHWQQVDRIVQIADSNAAPSPLLESGSQDTGLLQVEQLSVTYRQSRGLFGHRDINVINNISFSLAPGQTLGVVGESGCGKSTVAGALAGLKPVTSGSVTFASHDFAKPIKARGRDALRKLQMVFQNPDSSLNPRQTVRQILTRPLRCFNIVPRNQEELAVLALLRSVNLDDSYLDRRPRQLSGGEKQRVAIARAFAGDPLLIICDEPISSLDVSVQAAVLNLLRTLQKERGVALLFIAHDLNIVRYLSDEIVVLYLGKIVEQGRSEAVFQAPYHPYTEALVSAIPSLRFSEMNDARIRLDGSVPSPTNPPTGCRFHTRCPRKLGRICETHAPPAQHSDGKTFYCHIPANELLHMQTGAKEPTC
jgi:peptide/nickel transport system ATP-binding protein